MTKFATPLAPFNCCSENVYIHAVIIAELELGNIERHIFSAHFVEGADDATLEDRPEAFDGLRMHGSDDVLPLGVVNGRVRVFSVKVLIPNPLIGAEQADLVRDCFAHKSLKSTCSHVSNYAGHDIALAADCANDGRLTGTDATRSVPAAALIFVPVFGFAADSSTSTMPPSCSMSSMRAVLILWHMSHAVLYEPKPMKR
jgi:hypothetical protein